MTGKKTVAAAGTAEALGPPVSCRSVLITGLSTNTGLVWLGDAPYMPITIRDSTEQLRNQGPVAASKIGTPLQANEHIEWPAHLLSDVWIDAAVTGEGVSFTTR